MVLFLLQENFNAVCFLPHLIAHLSSGVLPFRVAGDVQYAANRIGYDGGLRIQSFRHDVSPVTNERVC